MRLKLMMSVMLALVLMACSQNKPLHHSGNETQVQVIKSPSDARDYRFVQLSNGLKVLLIHDKNSTEASASMNVMVGSASDPVQHQGLAHFLEHMLFLGSQKYPEANAFQQWVSQHGGQNNAFTALNNTNYFFNIKPQAFDQALSQFSRFFIDPLLDEHYIEREQHAVDAEFQTGLDDDGRRQMDVIKSVADPNHPFSRFSVGNLETLSSMDKPIRPDLLAFYQQYYVANNMALAVLSPESLDVMEKQVKHYFAAVRHEKELHKSLWPESPFDASALPRWVEFKAKKDIHQLSLYFPMPALQFNGSNSQSLLGQILGYEGAGSLLSDLKRQGLANALSAGTAWYYPGGSAFAIQIQLSQQGAKQKDQVLLTVFQAIALLKKQALPERLFAELKQINQLQFAYGEQTKPMAAVISASSNLQWYAPSHVLDAPYYYSQIDKKQLKQAINALSIDNALIVSTNQAVQADQQSPYYHVDFKQSPISATLKEALETAKSKDSLYLPQANDLIAQNVSLIAPDQNAQPQRIKKTPVSELWYQGPQQFLLPRAVSYYSWMAAKQNLAALDLYAALLNDQLDSLLYPASLAGLDVALYAHSRGLTLRIDGFSDKQALLLQQIIQAIQTAQFSPEQFQRIKAVLLRQWRNQAKNPPYQRALKQLSQYLSGDWTAEQKIAALERLQLSDIQAFSQHFYQQAYLRAMNTGNLSQDQAQAMLQSASALSRAKRAAVPPLKTEKLTAAWQKTISSQQGFAYVHYWQGQNTSLVEQVKWMVLAQLMQNPFFNQLRTEKQLGYVVFEQYFSPLTLPGLLFVVQSPHTHADKLHQAVMDFSQQQLTQLVTIDEAQWQAAKQAVAQSLLEKPKNLNEQASQRWYQLALGFEQFDYKPQLRQALDALTLAQWQNFARQLLDKKPVGQYVISTQASQWPDYRLLKQTYKKKKGEAF